MILKSIFESMNSLIYSIARKLLKIICSDSFLGFLPLFSISRATLVVVAARSTCEEATASSMRELLKNSFLSDGKIGFFCNPPINFKSKSCKFLEIWDEIK